MTKTLSPTLRSLGLVLVAAAVLAAPVQAAGAPSSAPLLILDPDSGQGWQKTADGVWARELTNGHAQTEYRGLAGLDAMVNDLNAQLVRLIDAYLANPTEDLARTLDAHIDFIEQVQKGMVDAPDEGRLVAKVVATDCQTAWSATCGGLSQCRNYASATASYSGPSAAQCYGSCSIYTYTYVDKTTCSDTLYTASQSCSDSGINISCSSYASLGQNGLKGCNTYSYASIYCPDISWSRSETCSGSQCGKLCLLCAPDPVEQ